MCLAIYKPAGTTIPKDHLHNGFDSNPDGAGFAYNDPEKGLITLKGFTTFKSFWKAFRKVEQHQSIIHFRWATHGVVGPSNCHPFPVQPGLAMIHNGMIDVDCHNQKMSDTWHFVEHIIKPLATAMPGGFLNNPGLTTLLSEFVSGSKLVFLSETGDFQIVNEEAGHWAEGVWYSNHGYSGWGFRQYSGFSSYTKQSDFLTQRERDIAAAQGYADGLEGLEGLNTRNSYNDQPWESYDEEAIQDLGREILDSVPLPDRYPEVNVRSLGTIQQLEELGYSRDALTMTYESLGEVGLERLLTAELVSQVND